MSRAILCVVAAVLVLSLAVPAFATDGSGGAGLDFGQHHATHAQDNGGFTGAENPGNHRGFAGWTGE